MLPRLTQLRPVIIRIQDMSVIENTYLHFVQYRYRLETELSRNILGHSKVWA